MTGAPHRKLVRADHLRRSPFSVGGKSGSKEWFHFCIHDTGLDLLINFSLVDDMRPGAAAGAETARITLLLNDGNWDGAVEEFATEDVHARGGSVDLAFADNRCYLRNGRYHIWLKLKNRPIECAVVLTPESLPTVSNNIQMDPGTPINWTVVPRLQATGHLIVDGRRRDFVDVPAYHDHNWGQWHWGRDFAWEWAYSLPDDLTNPSSIIFVRLNDRGHNRTYNQGLYIWKDGRPARVFRANEVTVSHKGLHPSSTVFRIPRPMALLTPGNATDVPAEVCVRAKGGADEATMRFVTTDVSQVIIPDDTDVCGMTTINEVTGTLSVEGTVGGTRVSMCGASIFEFVRGATS